MDFWENVECSLWLCAAYSLDFVQSLPRVLASFLKLRLVGFDFFLRSVQRSNTRFLDWSVRTNAYTALFLNCLFQLSQLIALSLEVHVTKSPARHSVHLRETVQPDHRDVFRQIGGAAEVFSK